MTTRKLSEDALRLKASAKRSFLPQYGRDSKLRAVSASYYVEVDFAVKTETDVKITF